MADARIAAVRLTVARITVARFFGLNPIQGCVIAKFGRAVGIALGLAVAAGPVAITPAAAADAAYASPWANEHATKVRLIGGGAAPKGQKSGLIAGIEIEMESGWKTYWRTPGTSGVPPRFDWAGSENLAAATPLFPAPQRFSDREGDTIGYKGAVILPVLIKPVDPALPVKLKLGLEYGVCKDVCVPVQPTLELTLPPDAAAKSLGSELAAGLAHVPREPASRKADDPQIKQVTIDLQGTKPTITIDAAFPGDGQGADIFLEAPDGIWVPLPKPVGEPRDGIHRFVVDLTDGADIADLKGRMIRATLVSASGQTDTSFKFE